MKSSDFIYALIAFFLVVAAGNIEFAHRHQFLFAADNLLVLSIYAVTALALAGLWAGFPNRLFGALLFTSATVLFLDLRLDLVNSLGHTFLFVAAGGLLAFWILGKAAAKVVCAVFGVMLIGVFLLPTFDNTQEFDNTQNPSGADKPLPVYVHVVLDEHIGVEGIDPEVSGQREAQNSLKQFFLSNRFRLYGRAYSEYFDTNDSLSSALNFEASDNPYAFYAYEKSQNKNILSENRYFRSLFAAGYKIRVYQTSFVDFCTNAHDVIASCFTYSTTGVSPRALRQLELAERLDMRQSMFWNKSFFKDKLHRAYNAVNSAAREAGLSLPKWPRARLHDIGPIPALPVFDQLIEDVAQAPPGTMFFAHMMLPHHPVSVNADCSIRRPVFGWHHIPVLPVADAREDAARAARSAAYGRYFEQSACALNKLSRLIERMKATGRYDNAIIVVHGDHGSRIAAVIPRIKNIDHLSPRDFYDGFSTLFAIKAPQFPAGYDLAMLPLSELLQQVTTDGPANHAGSAGHYVFLRDDQDSERRRMTMPEIPFVNAELAD